MSVAAIEPAPVKQTWKCSPLVDDSDHRHTMRQLERALRFYGSDALEYMAAARVPETVEPRQFGLWEIERRESPDEELGAPMVGFPTYTLLRHITLATMHAPKGEIVMEDSRTELSQHLQVWFHARGRVLVTGLGLGCVVRGLLHNPKVTHIDVVELDAQIIRCIGAEFVGNQRVTIHHADALTWEPPADARWNVAWHDIWCEDNAGLQVLHAKLIVRYHSRCAVQGAWKWPRVARRKILRRGVQCL